MMTQILVLPYRKLLKKTIENIDNSFTRQCTDWRIANVACTLDVSRVHSVRQVHTGVGRVELRCRPMGGIYPWSATLLRPLKRTGMSNTNKETNGSRF